MIFFLTTPVGVGHIEGFIRRFGREYGRELVEMTYDQLAKRGEAASGVYVFTDRIRMSESFRRVAGELWDQLQSGGDGFRLFNDPRNQLGRYELLRALHDRGLNRFNVFLLQELGDATIRFPVFLRVENDHGGPRSDLIYDVDSLWMEIGKLVLAGADPTTLLVTEFLDVRSPDGVVRKYGAWRYGDRIVGQHCLMSEHWNVKAENRVRTEASADETDQYFLSNPHKDQLMPYFEVAGIEYGRADFGVLDGQIQIWEINDNPQYFGRRPMFRNRFGKGEVFMGAYRDLARDLPDGKSVMLNLGSSLGMQGAAV